MAEANSATPEGLVSDDTKAVIEKYVQNQSIKNYTIDISVGSIKGDNYLGIIARVDISGEDESGKPKTLNLIAKSAPRSGFMRSFLPVRDFFEREIYAYTTLFPALAKFQAEKKIEHPFESVAQFHTSLIDESNEVLVLENMKVQGYRLWERRDPYDLNHALMAVREYGRLHAVSYALRDQTPGLFEELSANVEDILISESMCNDDFVESFEKNLHKFLECLDPVEDKIAYDKFRAFLQPASFFPIQRRLVSSEAAGRYAVIGHGDGWINNLLYKYEDKEEPLRPTKICLLDWQLVRCGSPVLDLSYLLFASTDKKLRDEYYQDLILEYYHSLSSHLVALGSNPAKLFPFDVFEEHLKTFSVFGLHMAMNTLMVITNESEDVPDVHNDVGLEVMENFMPTSEKTLEAYRTRLRGVILDFVDYGYL